MKKGFLVGLSIAVMLLAVGCAGGKKEHTPPAEEDHTSVMDSVTTPEDPVDDDTQDDDSDVVLDENAPEHITMDSISDTVTIPMYNYFTIDKKNVDFKYGEIKFPSQLYVDEALGIRESSTDLNDDDLSVKDFFKDSKKQYVYVKADGTLPATRPATEHVLTAATTSKDAAYTLEELSKANEGWTVKEITVDGADGFVLCPDTEKHDSGFASVLIYINVGAYEHAYGTDYCCMDITYQGGLADYSEVDFDEITAALLELIQVDFKQVK